MAELYRGTLSDVEIITVPCDDCAHRVVCVQAYPMDVLKKDICQTLIESGVSPNFLNAISIKCSQYLADQINERSMLK